MPTPWKRCWPGRKNRTARARGQCAREDQFLLTSRPKADSRHLELMVGWEGCASCEIIPKIAILAVHPYTDARYCLKKHLQLSGASSGGKDLDLTRSEAMNRPHTCRSPKLQSIHNL